MFSKAEKRSPILGSFSACLVLSFLVVSSTADELYGKMIDFDSDTNIIIKKTEILLSILQKNVFFSIIKLNN